MAKFLFKNSFCQSWDSLLIPLFKGGNSLIPLLIQLGNTPSMTLRLWFTWATNLEDCDTLRSVFGWATREMNLSLGGSLGQQTLKI
jgi:hypothetical protein